jgi:hypothetical protein
VARPTTTAKANRATPEEVGRAAGLKIRQDLARRDQVRRRHAAYASAQTPRPVVTRPVVTHQEYRQSVGAQTPLVAQAPYRSAVRTADAATLKAAPLQVKTDPAVVEVEAPSAEVDSTDTNPFAEAKDASETRPAAAKSSVAAASPFTETGSPSEPDAGADVNPALATQRRATAHTHEAEAGAASADAADTETKALTRRAALRAVSLRTVSPRTGRYGMPAPLVGSRAILEHQNEMSDAEGLERILDEDDLADRIARKFLVPVPTSIALTINGNLPVNHRYCRPWTALFLSDLARSHAAEFHRPFEVSSAVRTVAYQKRLIGVNGNAAAAEGDIVSPHLTGATIDIAKGPMSRQEISWMRTHLLPLEMAGKIDVEEEFQQACFHITVYKSYAPARRSTRSTTVMAKSTKPAVQPDEAPTEVAQAGDAAAPAAQASGHHGTAKHRHHARNRVVAQVDDPVGAMAERGR